MLPAYDRFTAIDQGSSRCTPKFHCTEYGSGVSHVDQTLSCPTSDAAPRDDPVSGKSPPGNGFVKLPTGVTLSMVATNG